MMPSSFDLDHSLSPRPTEGWKVIKRLALIIAWVIPLAACLSVTAGIIPGGPILSQPYFLSTLIIALGIFITVVLWQVSRMEGSAQDSAHYTPVQELGLIRYYTIMFVVLALLGLGITSVLLGWISLKYLLGAICAVFGALTWLTGYLRDDLLRAIQNSNLIAGTDGKARESFMLHYKSYYVDRRTPMMLAYLAAGIGAVVFYFFLEDQ